MFLKVVLIIIFIFNISNAALQKNCFHYEHQNRARPNLDTSILSSSGKFRIHYDESGINAPSNPSYINEVSNMIDQVRNIIIDDMGFLSEIPDEDGVYDIYIQDLGEMNYGFFIPDIPSIDDIDNFVSSSYIKIDNEYENDGDYYTTGLVAMKLTLAHEFFHAIQAAYREKNAGIDDYFYEMMGMWIEDIIVPEGNDYIHWVDDGESNNHFFMNPEMNIYSSDGYSIALFGHYLHNVYGNTIIREIWEEISKLGYDCIVDCGIESIDNVLVDKYNSSFANVWANFCSRNFFNGENQTLNDSLFFHEDQSKIISLKTYLPNFQNILEGELNTLLNINNSSSKFKIFRSNSLGYADILFNSSIENSIDDFSAYISVLSNLGPSLNQHFEGSGRIYLGIDDIIVLTASSLSNDFSSLNVGIAFTENLNIFYGDTNLDNIVNVVDIVLLIEVMLFNSSINQFQYENSDMNNDSLINIFDVVLQVELLLD
tara:strand:- start:2071 stop:3525 length:1455 start_codon:yes stop_codon:yes gene_type:complete